MTTRDATDQASPTAAQRKGFTLLAIMVAVVLLSTAVMAIGAANTTRLRSQTLSTSRSAALNVARTYLESVRGRDPWSVASEGVIHVDANGVVSSTGAFTRQLVVTVDRANLLRIEVIVTAPGLGAPIRLLTNAYRGGTMTPIG
jgi:Tfp pilus assembly protein PilV